MTRESIFFKYSFRFFWFTWLIGFVICLALIQDMIIMQGYMVGVAIAFFDITITSKKLKPLENFNKNENYNPRIYSILAYGFLIRMIIIFAGGFGLEFLGKNYGITFAVSYLIFHFSHIAAISFVITKKLQPESDENIDSNENTHEASEKSSLSEEIQDHPE